MGRRWLSALGWLLCWCGAYALVFRWGLWWWFTATLGVTCCLWLLLGRTIMFFSWRRPPSVAYGPSPVPGSTGAPRRIRRVILEEEEVCGEYPQ